MIFDENTSSLGLLNSTSGTLYSDMFGIVEDIGLTIPLKGILTNSSTFVLELTSTQSTLAKIVTSPNRYSNENVTSPTPCLPRWAIKRIEAVGVDVGDISIGQRTCSHKQHASVALMAQILNTCDCESYVYAKGKPKLE